MGKGTMKTSKQMPSSGFDPRIDYIRYSLSDIVVRGEWDDFGIFRFLNRLSFMSRHPLVFLIYHPAAHAEPQHGSNFVLDHEISVFDRAYKDPLIDAMEKHGFLNSKIESHPLWDSPGTQSRAKGTLNRAKARKGIRSSRFLSPDATNKYAIRMFDTNCRIVTFRLQAGGSAERPGLAPTVAFEPVDPSSELGSFIQRALLPFDGNDGRMLINYEIESRFRELRKNGAYVKASGDRPEEQKFSPHFSLLNPLRRPLVNIINKEYTRLTRSPLLKGFQQGEADDASLPVANVAFFCKTFSRSTTRFNLYFFDSVLTLGDAQLRQIRAGLSKASREHFIPYRSKEHSDQFWQLQSAGTEGREQIIKILRSSLSQHARLFTESVLMSGITMVAPDVFERGEIGWIEPDATGAEREATLLHFACLHYVLQFGAPRKPVEARNLSIISLPFRCSGGIWMCASVLRENVGDAVSSDLIGTEVFEEAYSIYHSLLRESERRIRREAKFAYLRTIGRLAADEAGYAMSCYGPNIEGPVLDRARIAAFNRACYDLARIYPFPLAQLHIVSRDDDQTIFSFKDFVVEEEQNPFFDRLTLRSFIEEGDVDQEVRNSMVLKISMGIGRV